MNASGLFRIMSKKIFWFASVMLLISGFGTRVVMRSLPATRTREITKLRDSLRDRGIALSIVHMPYQVELYASEDVTSPGLRHFPHRYQVQSAITKYLLARKGIRCHGLDKFIRDLARKTDIYEEDRFHIKEDAGLEIGEELNRILVLQNLLTDSGKPRHVTIMGG
jgi:hypothetical protein